tara:strand:+ start:1692 stop:3038 length:1347 start_codon:yes stop_codon:yes gene_type:complete
VNTKIQRLSGTIAAQSSAQGASGVAVIRVSGSGVKPIIQKTIKKELEHMKAELAPFYAQNGNVIDQVIALYFQSPSSYTGEDILEISCHGSIAVIDEILASLYQQGARPANAGEFTRRAFLNDKLDLTQAEAVADLIESTSIEVARAAKNSLEGAFSKKVFSILDSLAQLRSTIEASLDFPDEDLEETNHDKKLAKLFRETRNSYQTLLEQTQVACKIREGMVVAITGKPNVGKSTLLNQLIGHDRAIVSDEPGTTRDTIEVNTTIDGYSVSFVDTAGVRKTDNKVEKEGIRRALEATENADLIIEVKDATQEKITDAKEANENHLIAFNKADLLNNKEEIKPKANNAFLVSALEGRGINKIVENLSNRFKGSKDTELTITARRRHLTSLKESFKSFDVARKKEKNNEAGDIVAEELLQAQNSLSEITGEYSSEELLDSIFNKFCIGK